MELIGAHGLKIRARGRVTGNEKSSSAPLKFFNMNMVEVEKA